MNIRSSIVKYCVDEFDDSDFGNELADTFIRSMNSYITQSKNCTDIHAIFHKAKGELLTDEPVLLVQTR